MDIEEAWAAIENCRYTIYADSSEAKPESPEEAEKARLANTQQWVRWTDARGAARALALAVLEEATPHGFSSSSSGKPKHGGLVEPHVCPDCRAAMQLRARIEALGKEGP